MDTTHDTIRQQAEELQRLKDLQALHRQQLEENRKKALARRKDARRLTRIGQMVEDLLPDVSTLTDAELLVLLTKALAPYQDASGDLEDPFSP